LKERIVSEEGRKQQNKLKDLSPIAERLGCTLPQLAVGKKITRGVGGLLLLRSLKTCFLFLIHISILVKCLFRGTLISEAKIPHEYNINYLRFPRVSCMLKDFSYFPHSLLMTTHQ
jgi:hypothetical protein